MTSYVHLGLILPFTALFEDAGHKQNKSIPYSVQDVHRQDICSECERYASVSKKGLIGISCNPCDKSAGFRK